MDQTPIYKVVVYFPTLSGTFPYLPLHEVVFVSTVDSGYNDTPLQADMS